MTKQPKGTHTPDHVGLSDKTIGTVFRCCGGCGQFVNLKGQIDFGQPCLFCKLLAAAKAALSTLNGLAETPAFAGDAPEFNEGGDGYEVCQQLDAAITAAEGEATQ